MKTLMHSPKLDRRRFLGQLGKLGTSSILVASSASAVAGPQRANADIDSGVPSRYAHRLELHAEGVLTEPLMVWPWPPPTLPPIPPGSLIKMAVDFPWSEDSGAELKDVLQIRIYLVLPLPGAPEVNISRIHQRTDYIVIGQQPGQGNYFSVYGVIIANPDLSPFGQLTGLPSLNFGNFDKVAVEAGDITNFTLLGGVVAGSHATAAPNATGVLRLKGSWD